MIDLKIPAGDQVDLEYAVEKELIRRQKESNYANTEPHTWGKWQVLQGTILHGVQWSYVGEEAYDENFDTYYIEFPDGVDCQIDSSWYINENYSEAV